MLIVLKSFLWAKQNLTVLKCQFFSYSLLPKILKLRRSSLRLVFLIKIVYNQFLILKNYRLWHWIRSFIWFIPTNLGSVIFDQPAKPQIPNWCRVSWNFIKFEIKKGVLKRGKQTVIKAGFSKNIGGREEVERWREWKFCLGELQSVDTFVMLKATFSKHWLVKLAWHVCT